MSDERPEMTPQELDELASAYLDGEAMAEEAALVESDPRLQALVEEFRAVRDLLAAPVEVPSDEVRDQMIAQALDHRAPVVSMEKARRRLRAIPPQARVVLAAAAAVAALAMLGVTLFNQATRDEQDQFADDSAIAAATADAPEDSGEMPPPAPAAEPESAKAAEEPLSNPDSDDSAEVFLAEALDEEMEEEEMAIDLAGAPAEDSHASNESAEPEPMMDDEQEVATTSGEALLVFETSADLTTYAMQLAEELSDPQGFEQPDEAAAIDLMGCSLFPKEELELLARFDAVVDEIKTQVSVYLSEGDLQITETTPPPECELLNSLTLLDWLE